MSSTSMKDYRTKNFLAALDALCDLHGCCLLADEDHLAGNYGYGPPHVEVSFHDNLTQEPDAVFKSIGEFPNCSHIYGEHPQFGQTECELCGQQPPEDKTDAN